MTLRLVIADDELLVRSGIRMIVDGQPDMEVVGEASDGAEACKLARQLRPYVILMDLRMPAPTASSAPQRINESDTTGIRVLMLTTFGQDEHVYAAMKAGASGFLLESTPPEELVHGIRLVAGGETLLAPSITRRLVESFTQRPPPGASRPPELDDLTDRELEILGLIAGGLSNTEIAEKLFLSPGTVKSHVNHILSKLGLRDRVQAVIVAYETGLTRPGDRPRAPGRKD